jgi:hypothetical protein
MFVPLVSMMQGSMVMRDLFTEEIGDTLFAIAMAVAIGIGAANLAVQVGKGRAALDAAIATPGTVSTMMKPGDGPAG